MERIYENLEGPWPHIIVERTREGLPNVVILNEYRSTSKVVRDPEVFARALDPTSYNRLDAALLLNRELEEKLAKAKATPCPVGAGRDVGEPCKACGAMPGEACVGFREVTAYDPNGGDDQDGPALREVGQLPPPAPPEGPARQRLAVAQYVWERWRELGTNFARRDLGGEGGTLTSLAVLLGVDLDGPAPTEAAPKDEPPAAPLEPSPNHLATLAEFRAGRTPAGPRERAEQYRSAARSVLIFKPEPEQVARMLEQWAEVQDAIADATADATAAAAPQGAGPGVCECCEGNPAVLTRHDAKGGPLHLCDDCHDDLGQSLTTASRRAKEQAIRRTTAAPSAPQGGPDHG